MKFAGIFYGLAIILVSIQVSCAENSKGGCPVASKCPYYSAHKGEHSGEKGCPLNAGGCPYYDKHAKDQTLEDIISKDVVSECPMNKCPYFEVLFLLSDC